MAQPKAYIEKKSDRFWQSIFQFEADYLADRLSTSSPVLSIGCGTGVIEGHLSKRGFALVGLDATLDFIKKVPQGVLALAGRAESLPFPADCFDAAVAVASFQFMEDIPGAISEAHRVLRREGRLFLLLLNPGSDFVRKRMADPVSYFSRMRQPDIDMIARHVSRLFFVSGEYTLSLVDGVIMDGMGDPERSLLYILQGARKSKTGGE